MLTLADLTSRTGLDVLSHLEREAAIPVIDGLQAQGDLIVVPIADLTQFTIVPNAHWREVPGSGIDVLRAGAGGNPHTLVADPGACRWTTGVRDNTGLALGALAATAVAYLVHPSTAAAASRGEGGRPAEAGASVGGQDDAQADAGVAGFQAVGA